MIISIFVILGLGFPLALKLSFILFQRFPKIQQYFRHW